MAKHLYQKNKDGQFQQIFAGYQEATLPFTFLNNYLRQNHFTADKNTVIITPLLVTIGSGDYLLTQTVQINLNNMINREDRKGKDCYLHAYSISSASTPEFIITTGLTLPYDLHITRSRLIGGFHCLCEDAINTPDNHALHGYIAGDIIPNSVWDLKFRPYSEAQGMVFDPQQNKWFDIYLTSRDNSQLNTPFSSYNAQIVTGTIDAGWNGELFSENLKRVRKRLMYRHEFVCASRGTPQGTAIKNAVYTNLAGGHYDTNDVRILSDIGLEDCCGVMQQWTEDIAEGGNYGVISESDGYLSDYTWDDGISVYSPNIDPIKKGEVYGRLRRLAVGGDYNKSFHCGSRFVQANNFSSLLVNYITGRGVSDAIHS